MIKLLTLHEVGYFGSLTIILKCSFINEELVFERVLYVSKTPRARLEVEGVKQNVYF